MMYPLVREFAADGIPVTVTCRVLGFSPQAYYKWRSNPVCEREWSDAHLVDAAREIHADDPAFGYRFIADELWSTGGPEDGPGLSSRAFKGRGRQRPPLRRRRALTSRNLSVDQAANRAALSRPRT